MKVIGIKVANREHGDFVIEALRTAIAANRVTLDDIALVAKDEAGKLQIQQTKDITTRKGVKRGTLVGALVGLAAPPVLAATVVGAGAGALWGKFRDRGIDDNLMKSVGEMMISGDEAVVFALGADASIDAIDARVREVLGGEATTITLNTEDEALVREAADHVPEPTAIRPRVPIS